jgi:hypothetical protein
VKTSKTYKTARCDYWTVDKGQCENEAMDGWTMCRSHLGFDPDYVDDDDECGVASKGFARSLSDTPVAEWEAHLAARAR